MNLSLFFIGLFYSLSFTGSGFFKAYLRVDKGINIIHNQPVSGL